MQQEKIEIALQEILDLLDKKYCLADADWGIENPKILEKVIEERSTDCIWGYIEESENDARYYGLKYAKEELQNDLCRRFDLEEDEAQEIIEEYEEDIEEEIFNRDESTFWKDILRHSENVPVRIELLSNYDCINSHWLESQGGYSYQESYFGDMIDALRLNPQEVKKFLVARGVKCVGRWTNKPNRKPLVNLGKAFWEEIENSCCGANLLTILGTIDLSEMTQDFTKITIPKGNPVGLFSSFQGGGSLLEMELLEDLEIDLDATGKTKYDGWRLEPDFGSYSVASVYGACKSIYGEPIKTA